MIKSEINDDKQDDNETIPLEASYSYLLLSSVVVAAILVVISFAVFFSQNSSTSAPRSNSSKYKDVQALPLGTNQSSDKQASTNTSNLGAGYTGLQNVPQNNNITPISNNIQSTGQAQNTGQFINPNLPY